MVTFKFSCLQNGTLTVKGNQIDWSLNLNKCWEITEDRVLRRMGREEKKEERERKEEMRGKKRKEK